MISVNKVHIQKLPFESSFYQFLPVFSKQAGCFIQGKGKMYMEFLAVFILKDRPYITSAKGLGGCGRWGQKNGNCF